MRMTTYRVVTAGLGVLAVSLAFAPQASAGPDRRPCVAPDSPSGCSALDGPSPPVGPPSLNLRRNSVVQMPLNEPPEDATKKKNVESTVTVKPGAPKEPNAAPGSGEVGPPKPE